jgi:hypothetical protein
MCTTTRKNIQLRGHYTEFNNPTIYLMQIFESTMDDTTPKLPCDGCSKFIYPQTDLITKIQQYLKDKHIQWTKYTPTYQMIMAMAIVASLLEPYPVQATYYPPNYGVLYYKGDTPCGHLPKDIIIVTIHHPKFRSYFQQNNNIDEYLWDNIHWAAHSTAFDELNIELLLPTIKFIHNEWLIGLSLDKCYDDVAGCPHRGEEDTI